VETPRDAAGRPAAGRSPRRRLWIILSIVGVLALCAIAIPVRFLVLPLVSGTIAADRGEQSPSAALLAFVLTFNDGDSIGVDRLIVRQRRAEISQQRREYISAIAADRQTTGSVGIFTIASGEPTDRTEIHGNQATVVDSYRVRWTRPSDAAEPRAGTLSHYGEPRAWRAELRRDRTGWRLWSVTIPRWCGEYSRCGAPRPTASPTPEAEPS